MNPIVGQQNDGLTHFVGDACEGGHRTLVERLRGKCPYCHPCSADEREAAARIEELEVRLGQMEDIAENRRLMIEQGDARLERMEAVVEAARRANEQGRSAHNELIRNEVLKGRGHEYKGGCCGWSEFLDRERAALAALDGLQNRSDTGTDTQSAQVVSGDENKSTYHNLRSCPNAVSWCGGPDRYGDTCAACLATWTEEAKEKNA